MTNGRKEPEGERTAALDALLAETARRADALARRRGPAAGAKAREDRRLWLRAEQEIMERAERSDRRVTGE